MRPGDEGRALKELIMNKAPADLASEVEALHTWLDKQGAPRTVADGSGATVTCSLKARVKLLNGSTTIAPCRTVRVNFTHPTIGDGIYTPMMDQAYTELKEAEKALRDRGDRCWQLMEFTASNGVSIKFYNSMQVFPDELDDPVFE